MSDLSAVEEYWNGVTQRLQVETDVLNRLVGHNGEMGRANELSLAQLLSSLLPNSVGIGTGVVIDSAGRRSSQSDVVIYDAAMQPQVLAQSVQLLFPVETVIAVIEVKTTVNIEAVKDARAKAKNLRLLQDSRAQSDPPFYGLFGYECAGSISRIAHDLMELPRESQPDITCIVNPGLYGNSEGGNALDMRYVPLHERQNGSRVSGSWARPATSDRAATTIGGSLYPIGRFVANSRDRYAFEPGRALLLFCNSLLNILASRGKIGTNWLANYLPAIALETVATRTTTKGA